MTSIHPRLKFHYLRDDGDGGLDLVVTTSNGQMEIRTLSNADIAAMLTITAAYCEKRFRADHCQAQAARQLAGTA